jgi:GNAT superfamily N-acetyltransferase
MNIRKATREDLSTIVSLLADDELGLKREDYSTPLTSAYQDAFEKIQKDPNQELIVLENQEGMIIGTLQLSFIQYLTYQGGIRAQIEAVRIHRDHRGSGIGSDMFGWAIDQARKRGAHVMQLTTDKKRLDALRFYENLGFVASHEGVKLHFQ